LIPLVYLSGTMSVIGHCFPVQYIIALCRFKFDWKKAQKYSGGKGVSTTGGILFAVSPWLGLIAFGIWLTILLATRYVSLGSMFCMLLTVFLIFIDKLNFLYLFDRSLLFHNPLFINWSIRCGLFALLLINAMIVIARHYPNIQRLLKHQERKFF
jgi:glycerol-3-phosphate acyltransferase PlsY